MLDKTLDRPAILERLTWALGTGGVLTETDDVAPFATDWRKLFRGAPFCVLRPGQRRGGLGRGAHLRRGGPRHRPPGREHVARRRRHPGRERAPGRGQPGAHEPGPRSRPGRHDDDCRGRPDRAPGAGGGAGGRLPLPALLRRRGLGDDRGRALDQRRRQQHCASATPASSCSASRWCCRTGGSGTGCARCARTIPAMPSGISSSAPRARSASSPPRRSGSFRCRAATSSPSAWCATRMRRSRSSGAFAPPTRAACEPSSTCPAPASIWC